MAKSWNRATDAAIGWLATIGVAFALQLTSVQAQDKVRFALGWTDLGYFTSLFVAQEQGYFKEENLEVTLTYGSGAAQALQQTGAGLFDLAIADITVGLQAHGQGVPIKLVSTFGAKSVIAYVALEESGIRSPKDLEGRTLAGPPSDTGIVLLPAFASVAGFDGSKVKVLNLDAGARVPALFRKNIDVMVSFDGGSVPILELEASKQGKKLVIMRWRDYGFDAMGLGIWGNANFVAQKPDVVQRFLKAAGRGARFMVRDPDKAAQIYVNVAATLNPDATRAAVRSFAKTFDHPSQKKGIGYIDPADLKSTHDLAVRFSGLKPLADLNEVYTNTFIESAPVMP